MPKLADLFKELEAKNRAEAEARALWIKTPEGIAHLELEAELVAADERGWLERHANPTDESDDED